jgi:hypothetical protein
MGKKVNIEVGGETGNQHRWSCLSCGTMGPWLAGRSTEISTVMRITEFTTLTRI